jgi:tRNA(Met) cytidine acetyltransferase
MLGRSFAAVVVDGHGGIEPDLLGRCHGFVRGGGALVLRCPTAASWSGRFAQRLERVVARHPHDDATPIDPSALLRPEATPDQDAAVDAIVAAHGAGRPVVLVADRGRGKSVALGRALRRLGLDGAVLTAAHPDAIGEVTRFAGDASPPVVEPSSLLAPGVSPRAVVVDEAAQLPVALLRKLMARHPGTWWVFATTVHGYEGTGRGFQLRFADRLPDAVRVAMDAPVRWGPGCPLERFVYDALLLDAEPDTPPEVVQAPAHARLDRDALAADEGLLRAVFGLLVQAHYRTTPNDLQRMLDAPGVAVHVLRAGGRVVATTLVAREGGLTREVADDLAAGRRRLRGQALPEVLADQPDVARLDILRSVRIVTHPAVRRQGLARRLVDAVHATYAPDLFGTLFGATPALVRFRRAVGYRPVRLGVGPGSRTGEPAVAMLRPATPAGAAAVRTLESDLALTLDAQVAYMAADGGVPVEAALVALLRPVDPDPPSAGAETAMVARYLDGPATFESVAGPVAAWVAARAAHLDALAAADAALLRTRVLERRGWDAAAAAAGLPTRRAAMRALRRAVRRLRDAVL